MICNIHGTTGCSDEFSCGSCKSGYSGKACRACSKGYYVSDNNMKLKQMGEGVSLNSLKWKGRKGGKEAEREVKEREKGE